MKKRMNKEEILLVLKKNKVWRPILAGMATAVLILLVLCGIKDKEMKEVESTNLVVREMESSKEDMIQELTNVSSYLDTLDQSVVTNKESLDELTAYSTDVTVKVEELENSVTGIERMFEEYLLSHESVSEDIKANITGITDELQMVKKDIVLSKQELVVLMEEVRSTGTEQTESVFSEINTVKERLEENKKELALTYESIVSMMDVLTVTEEKNHAELVTMLTKAEQELNTLLTEEMASLTEMLTKSNEEMHMLVEENVVKLSEKMTSLHNEIVDAKGDIAVLLEEMKSADTENQKEMEAAFQDIKATFEVINQDFTVAHDEIKELIHNLTQNEAMHHTELLSTLNEMEASMNEESIQGLEQILCSLSDFEERYATSMDSLASKMNQNFTDMSTSMSGQMAAFSERMENNFSNLSDSVNNQYQKITTTVNQGDNNLKGYLDSILGEVKSGFSQVFQYVSDGKKLLASALLTKGVNCAEDATFAEIYQAILNIPQELVIGVQELPGSISYEYHYHIDTEGNEMHAEILETAGGCYMASVYHVHSGNSNSGGGCYSTPVYHTHIADCYSEGSHTSDCPYHREYHSYDCAEHDYHGDGGACEGFDVYDCGGHRYLSCSLGNDVIGYSLNCGKDNSSIEGYRPACGLVDGQIVGAYIVYDGSAAVNVAFYMMDVPETISFTEEDISVLAVEEESVSEESGETIASEDAEIVVNEPQMNYKAGEDANVETAEEMAEESTEGNTENTDPVVEPMETLSEEENKQDAENVVENPVEEAEILPVDESTPVDDDLPAAGNVVEENDIEASDLEQVVPIQESAMAEENVERGSMDEITSTEMEAAEEIEVATE